MQWVFATLGALVLGLATNAVYDLVKHGAVRRPFVGDRSSLPSAARSYDSTADGLYPFVTWSRSRQLVPERLETAYVGRLERRHVLSGDPWDRHVRDFEESGERGRTAYISALEVDTGEHPGAHAFRVTIAESSYAQCLTTKALLDSGEPVRGHVLTTVREGARAFARVAPPTMVSACVAVINSENRLLALRRSLAVRTYPAQWTVGINESMKYNDEPGQEEDFFGLVRRGLQEELGLGEGTYGEIRISWLGWSNISGAYTLVAVVRSNLRSTEIDRRREQCHGVYEHDLAVWLPLTRSHIGRIVTHGASGPDQAHPWSYLAPLVAAEVWRCRGFAYR